MKKLDAYVLTAFLKNYLISLFVLVGFYIVMDMVFNFDEFADHSGDASVWSMAWAIASYYFFQSFFVYAQLAGIIPVLAAAFTLMRMSRFNELTALLAAGVPLLRVAAPIILAAVALNLLIQPINQELVIPALASQITRDHDEALGDPASTAFPVRAMPDGDGGVFDAARFHPFSGEPAWAESLTIVERDTDGNIERMISAHRADWDNAAGAWRLTDGRVIEDIAVPAKLDGQSMLAADSSDLRTSPAVPIEMLQTPVTPAEIQIFRLANIGVGAGASYFDLLSTTQMNELLERPRQYASADLLRAKHTRLSSHVMNIVLILLAIPAVLTREPGHLRRAAGRTLLLVGAAMGTVFLCQMLAREPPTEALATRWPAWMAWTPVMIFGPLAVILLDKLET
jgi:lipopolysaccharide export LptBFGC system permease protein LptF